MLTSEQLHAVGMAITTVEKAVADTPEAFRGTERGHAEIVGDAVVFALAMKGFVVEHDHKRAAEVAAEYERAPEQAPKLS